MYKRRIKILLIEDDLDLIKGWQDLFEFLEYEQHSYSRAMDALNDRAWIETCDVLLSDYYLPDINGVDLIRKVRQINPNLPAILLTGSRDHGIMEAAAKIERCEILHKPLNIEDIEKRIEGILKQAG